ncbi:M4 family metallopeptidase [Archangium sp.]|uniref:M4 family metallopeptidase n=1 Tax=Archangium sp. TaxID=1872627 RepID=UPI002ED8856D
MVRNRILAALLTLPLAACGVEGADATLPENTDGVGTLSSADIQAALSAIPGAEVLGTHQDGVVPFMVRGDFGSTGPSPRGLAARDANARVGDALHRIAPLFRLLPTDLVVRSSRVDEQGHTHIRYAQTKNGLPVVGHELLVHVDPSGRIYAVNGSARDGENVLAVARISSESATQAAVRGTVGTGLAAQSARLVYYRAESDHALKLAYEVVVTGEGDGLPLRDHVFVSARDGSILGRTTDIHTAMNRKVYSANNGSSTPGTLKRGEGAAATGDNHVDTNYARLGDTYNCYKTLFNRDSINNAGATLISTVHYGSNYVNAYWDGTQMVYGDGNGTDSTMLGLDLDVTVHELTHAVTENESNLTYSGQSGGLNESMSDIFAGVCESWLSGTWSTAPDIFKIGEDIWTPATAGDALRYMDDPFKDGASLDYYPNYTSGTDVHYSSGISNLAFALMSKGGTHPRGKTTVSVAAIGVEKAGRIFYKANTDLFTASTTFAQARTYTEQAAEVLYGTTSAEKASVTQAWQAVGVGGTTTPPPSTCSSSVALSNGVTLTNISAGTSAWSCTYTLAVSAGSSNLKFDLSGGTGDGDMYVKFGAEPTSTSYDCRPYKGGNTESCAFATPSAGTYYVKIFGYTAASGMSLKGAYTAGSGGSSPLSVSNIAGASGSAQYWTYNVTAGQAVSITLRPNAAGSTGDADLYVKFGAQPSTTVYDCRPYQSGNTETCTLTAPSTGTYHIMLRGYSAYTGVDLKAQ